MSATVDDVRHAIDWYVEAVPAGSLVPLQPPPSPAEVEATILEAGSAISPFQLPPEVVWLWRTWDPTRFTDLPYPRLTRPDFALQCWRQDALESGHPKILFPVAYESHGFLLVEMSEAYEQPAPIWYYAYADEAFVLTYPSLASLFRACAEAVEIAGARPPSHDNDRYAVYAPLFDGPTFDAIVERHFTASAHGTRERRVAIDPMLEWPDHWQRAQGLDSAALKPAGATHTVRAFAEAAATSPLTGRLVGVFRSQGGGSFAPGGAMASFGTFTDPTGTIPVLLPHSVLDVGGRDGTMEVEIEIEATTPIPAIPELDTRDIQNAALSGEIANAQALGAQLGHALHNAATQVPLIRRMIPPH
ncbi:hypothetical protein [Actinospongicola halichondriae]|uniref:hypothetical protein n=1 Tax=Actinospongicola halichondriae TaxID=3236844 RepID=UPI003D39D2BE